MAGKAYKVLKEFWLTQDSGDYTRMKHLFAKDAVFVDPIYGTFNGREEVREFLRKRVVEMQIEGIIHKVENVVSDGKLGAFKANVIGKDKSKKPFFGLVEIKDDKIIYYRVLPLE